MYEVYDVSQGIHYSLVDGLPVQTGDADVSYMAGCSCSECEDYRVGSNHFADV